ncbi:MULTISPECIES: BMP family ABC transporter substrate-binding protein [Delftia]|jgi:basic membrane protein A and related proteins|uniref:BMP family ABC transporter substrate-binding protein n=3 Tax=Delftia TaxID=80865 RepID=A0A1H3M7Z0_9BURK|nr:MULTISPECIES: BMP family ABC transporter substrate-binding protein [Delftia]KAA9173654.1 BMP family ABC transporter substrate-binding protein [Delftia sp. BR1]AOV02333.1 BMP family ABC transporter substrate-binding protein [Delftia tsuruhatensis]EPD35391.1 simple sugar transport system substrate-binding protein [Delftia acidovorans CCUG 274B]EPD42238.1 simple sugar transport system substrate-binding protein [Delftia acidovorans CCUG 15835]MCO5338062.1 BMP family ABC transporter substrate-bi
MPALRERTLKPGLKSTLVKMIGLSAISVAALTACGKKEEAAAPAPAAAPAAQAPAEKLKIGFMYVSPIGDGGWTFQHELGRKAIQEKFGDKVETSFVESVPESADAERVMRDMAGQGNKLIFATSFGYQEFVQKVAADLKDVKFEHATGYKNADNVATYDTKTFEGAYLAGIVAGGMTKTKTIGVVASVPIPEVVRNINSFVLGAQSVDPSIKAKVVWVNEWFAPPKESEAATSLINGGVDVLYQNTNSPAVLKTAEERGARAFGKDGDMSAFAPKAHLGSAVIDWTPYYSKVTQDTLDGKWQGGSFWWGVKEGAIDLVKIADDVPQDIKDKVAKARDGLKDGSFAVWTGPIKDNAGKEVLTAGQVGDLGFMTSINFFVNGVEGKVPGAK